MNFTENNSGNTMSIIANTIDEDEVMSRYHHENAIYLYCTMERATANQIIQTNCYPVPLCLYETPDISRAMAVNMKEPVTLRVALNQKLQSNEIYYDQLTMVDTQIKEKFKIKSIEEYKKKCTYTRCLITEPKTKIKVIEYKVFNASKLYINPQYV